jgi:hypothetical protein
MMIAALVELARTIVIMRHMHQRKVVSDNEWTGWLRRMRSCFEQGKIREYWQSGLELEKWFDPAFINIIIEKLLYYMSSQTAIYHNDNKYMQNRYSEQVILKVLNAEKMKIISIMMWIMMEH